MRHAHGHGRYIDLPLKHKCMQLKKSNYTKLWEHSVEQVYKRTFYTCHTHDLI